MNETMNIAPAALISEEDLSRAIGVALEELAEEFGDDGMWIDPTDNGREREFLTLAVHRELTTPGYSNIDAHKKAIRLMQSAICGDVGIAIQKGRLKEGSNAIAVKVEGWRLVFMKKKRGREWDLERLHSMTASNGRCYADRHLNYKEGGLRYGPIDAIGPVNKDRLRDLIVSILDAKKSPRLPAGGRVCERLCDE